MTYEFRDANGRICCRGKYLCPACRVRAGLVPPVTASSGARMTSAATEPERKTAAEWNRYWAKKLGVGSLVFETPDPYRAATDAAPRRWTLEAMDPNYDPYGEPVDPYVEGLGTVKK